MLKNQKYLFNLKKDIHYLNCAYKAPLLKANESAALNALVKERNPSDIIAADFFNDTNEVRTLFGEIVNCSHAEVAIIPSTSYGFSAILNNINCKKEQHALTIENDFPSSYFSLKRWCETHKADLKIVKPDKNLEFVGAHWNNKIISCINSNTAVVVLSSVHWMTGLKFDLEKIGKKCKSVGAKFIVDGTQSVGVLPIDVEKYNIDALVCASYKWLFGPYSLCLAYLGSHFNNGIPLEEAWLNRTNAQDINNLTKYDPIYKPDAGRYNVGETSNFILMPMLKQALIQVKIWLKSDIQSYSEHLVEPLLIYLKNLGVKFESSAYFSTHLFNLNLPKEIPVKLLKEKLVENKIYLSVRGNSLRVSIHIYNTSEDIEKLIQVIEETRRFENKNEMKI